MTLNLNSNEKSAFTSYPDYYKFFSLEFILNPDLTHTDRECKDFLDLCSDIGGVLEMIKVFFGALTIKFSTIRMQALLTNRLFH